MNRISKRINSVLSIPLEREQKKSLVTAVIAGFVMKCELATLENSDALLGDGVNARLLLAKAKQIDGLVSRYMLSSDAIERRDIINSCNTVIDEVDGLLKTQGVKTEEQRRALNVFREAQQYYKTNCMKK